MTTATEVKAYPTDAEIAAVMEERKLNRIGAVQYLRRKSAAAKNKADVTQAVKDAKAGKPIVAAKPAPKPKAAKSAKSAIPETSDAKVKFNTSKDSADMQRLDDVIRKALRAGYGRPVPILGVLGMRFAAPSKKSGYPFYRVLADAGKDGLVTVFVSGFSDAGGELKASISNAVKSSYTVKALLARLERKAKRAAAKA